MRNAFADEVTRLASADQRIVLLSGDIGNRLFDKYKAVSQARFFNCGVAEANMMGVAAGLALCGFRPVVYTINSFLITRSYEQIRLDICYHNVPVVLVGVGAGLGYASLGPTHHSCEDIAIMRVLPHMTVICPGDPVEVRLALQAAVKHNAPVFIRLGKKGEPIVHKQTPAFSIGKGIVLREGTEACLLSSGVTLPLAVDVAEKLMERGISSSVVSYHTVKPLDEELLKKVFASHRVVATIEEHSVLGGLGGSVSEWLADQLPQKAKFFHFGTADRFLHEACELDYAREHLGLSREGIITKLTTVLGG